MIKEMIWAGIYWVNKMKNNTFIKNVATARSTVYYRIDLDISLHPEGLGEVRQVNEPRNETPSE